VVIKKLIGDQIRIIDREIDEGSKNVNATRIWAFYNDYKHHLWMVWEQVKVMAARANHLAEEQGNPILGQYCMLIINSNSPIDDAVVYELWDR